MEPISVRGATLDDAAVICTIYNQGIADRLATLETELRDTDERRRWLSARGTRYPVVSGRRRGRWWRGRASIPSTRAGATTTWPTSPSTWSGAGGARAWDE